MGVPNSEVGYIIATTRKETTKVHKNMWWHWVGGGEFLSDARSIYSVVYVESRLQFHNTVQA